MKKILLVCSVILAMVANTSLQAQNITVTGRVTAADDGNPLPGVNVIVDGSSTGTTTNADGNYTLSNVPPAGTIVFSFIGLQTQQVPVNNRSIINVQMQSDVQELSEVVVTGVGVATDKRKVAISVESVKAEDLTQAPQASIDQALVGRIPGATIQSVTGQPGQQANILLRGINTLGSTQPMILIDGIQVNTTNNFMGSTETNVSSRLADLDLTNIERIEVVQGAAAATIYGAQGANGVIQIFTKRGKAGKPVIEFSSRFSVDNMIRLNPLKSNLHFFPTDEQGRVLAPGGVPLEPNPETGVWRRPQRPTNLAGVSTDKPFVEPTYDQLGQVVRNNALTFNNSLSVSGGTERTNYAFTLSNLNQESIIFGKFNRTNLRLNLGFELFKGFKVNLGTTLIASVNTTGGITGVNNVYSALGFAINSPQYIDLTRRDAIGNYVATPAGDNSVNSFYTFDNRSYDAKVARGIQNINLNYTINKFFEVDYKYGIDHYRYDYEDKIVNQENFLSKGIAPITGEIVQRLEQETFQNSILTGFVRTNFRDDFGIDANISTTTHVAFDWRNRSYRYNRMQGTTLPPYPSANITSAAETRITDYRETFVTYGWLINQVVDFGGVVGVSGGIRADWSSAFGRGSRPFVFPRGDIYFRPTQVEAIGNAVQGFMPEWKLRAAYGEAGVQPEPFDRIISFPLDRLGGNPVVFSQFDQTNPNLGVQVSRELEIGTDISFRVGSGSWLSTINPSFTYWTRTSDDVIRELDVAPSTGASTIRENALTFASNGIQASINATIFNNETTSWNFTTNLTRSLTTVKNIANKADITLGGAGGNGYVLREGAPIGTFFGRRPLRSLDELRPDGTPYIPEAQRGNFEVSPDGYVVNTSTQAVSFTSDQQIIGDANPDFVLSFINDFRIHKFINISFQIDWFQGFQIYNQTRQWLYRDLIHKDLERPISIGGEERRWTNYYNSLYLTNNSNAHFVEDGSFARLRDVTVAFDITQLVPIRPFRVIRASVSGRNLVTLTKYSGLDPEAAAGVNNPVTRGLDQYSFPNFRSVYFGLNFGF